MPDRVSVGDQQNCRAAEQGNNCEQQTSDQIAEPMMIWGEGELAPGFDSERTQQRPEQQNSGDQQRAVKKFLEVIAGQEWKNPVRRKPLRGPEQNRREQRAEKERCGEVGEQSRCVFQDCYVRLRRDAQSTHMDGKGW